jgi:predicted PurR-regulated permease PerM
MKDVLRLTERVDPGSLGRASLRDGNSPAQDADSGDRTQTSPPIRHLRSEALVARTLQWIALASFALLIMTGLLQVALLLFAGVLVGVPLRAASALIARRMNLTPGVALALVLIAIAALVGTIGWFLAPRIAEQSGQVMQELPEKWRQLQDRLAIPGGAHILDQFSDPSRATIRALVGKSFGAISGALGALGSAFVILFIGLYLAASPGVYVDGLIRLIAVRHRARARDVLQEVGVSLLWWLLGKLASMALVGVLTFLGLWFFGVPLALTLSLLACALTFIPNFGPILSAAPAVLFALGQGLATAGYVVALYVVVQTVESYLVTPLVQQRTISLAPALTIAMQLILGVLAGILGLALATPLTAAGLVLVREIYVRDIIERPHEFSRQRGLD